MRYLLKYLNKLYVDKSREEKVETKLINRIVRDNRDVHESLVPLINFISYLLINQPDDIKEMVAEQFLEIYNTEERQNITNKLVMCNNVDWTIDNLKKHKDTKQIVSLQDYVTYDEKKQEKVSIITFSHWFAYVKNTNTLLYQNILYDESQYPIDTLSYLYFSFFPLFQELKGEAKFLILNEQQWYFDTLEIDYKELFLKQETEDFTKNLKKVKISGAESTIQNLEQDIQRLISDLNAKYKSKEKVSMEYLYHVGQGYDEAMNMFFGYLKSNDKIDSYEFTSKDTIRIHTKPLYMEFVDEARLEKAIPSFADKKLQKHLTSVLEGTELLGLGSYYLTLQFKKSGVVHGLWYEQNHIYNGHVNANCLGTFEPPIIDAKRNYNLVRLLDIFFQYMQAVNVADSAGQSTLKNSCYFKDIKTGNVTYMSNENDSVKEDEVENETLFLERRHRS